MSHLLTRVVATALLSLAGIGVAPAVAAEKAPPAAVVSLDGVGMLGRFDAAVISGTVQCRAGSVEQELVISVYQGNEAGTHAITDFPCDGYQHRFSTSLLTDPLGGPFVPGQSWVDARLTVHEPVMHDPLPQGHDANAVWLRPSAKITGIGPVVLSSDGTLTVTADATCRGPWATDSISVQVLQPGDTQVDGSTWLSEPAVPCDGIKHRLQLVVDPAPGVTFVAKPTLVVLAMSIWDADDTGDPINGTSWEGTIKVVRR